jgi:hypothetical protein
MNGDTCILVGRGPSADALTWPCRHDVMAVSSGIFKIPSTHPPEHFATLDTVKYYMAGLWPDAMIAWSNDSTIEPWPFWADQSIRKHVLSGCTKRGTYRTLPRELIDHIPPKHRDAFNRELVSTMHLFGFQPQWGDYSTVIGWRVDKRHGPALDDALPDPVLGLEECPNSLLFGVQVAHQLGYRHLVFAGCDLWQDHHEEARVRLVQWSGRAKALGLRWSCLTDESFLAGTIPVLERLDAA